MTRAERALAEAKQLQADNEAARRDAERQAQTILARGARARPTPCRAADVDKTQGRDRRHAGGRPSPTSSARSSRRSPSSAPRSPRSPSAPPRRSSTTKLDATPRAPRQRLHRRPPEKLEGMRDGHGACSERPPQPRPPSLIPLPDGPRRPSLRPGAHPRGRRDRAADAVDADVTFLGETLDDSRELCALFAEPGRLARQKVDRPESPVRRALVDADDALYRACSSSKQREALIPRSSTAVPDAPRRGVRTSSRRTSARRKPLDLRRGRPRSRRPRGAHRPDRPDARSAVQPELIGGLVVRIGDVVYDRSVRHQLDTLRDQLVERAADHARTRLPRGQWQGQWPRRQLRTDLN